MAATGASTSVSKCAVSAHASHERSALALTAAGTDDVDVTDVRVEATRIGIPHEGTATESTGRSRTPARANVQTRCRDAAEVFPRINALTTTAAAMRSDALTTSVITKAFIA